MGCLNDSNNLLEKRKNIQTPNEAFLASTNRIVKRGLGNFGNDYEKIFLISSFEEVKLQ